MHTRPLLFMAHRVHALRQPAAHGTQPSCVFLCTAPHASRPCPPRAIPNQTVRYVQMAEGLHFGIVPYVSRPALGVVTGLVGAGGNFGAVIYGQYALPASVATDRGFIQLGLIIVGVSCIMHFLYVRQRLFEYVSRAWHRAPPAVIKHQ